MSDNIDPELSTELDQMSEQARTYLYDRATAELKDTPVNAWIDNVVVGMRDNPHYEYDVSDDALRQAALEAAAEALQAFATDGYHDHFPAPES